MSAIRRILAAVKDPQARRLPGVRKAARLAAALDAELILFHAIAEPSENELFVPRPYDIHHHRELYERHATEHLDRVLPPSSRARVHARLRTAQGNAEEEILRAADDGIDMIVMGVGRATDSAFGSTVNYVVRNARCPVLTVRR